MCLFNFQDTITGCRYYVNLDKAGHRPWGMFAGCAFAAKAPLAELLANPMSSRNFCKTAPGKHACTFNYLSYGLCTKYQAGFQEWPVVFVRSPPTCFTILKLHDKKHMCTSTRLEIAIRAIAAVFLFSK